MKQDLSNGHGIRYSILGGRGYDKGDAQAILDFNTSLNNGVKPAKAWATTMSDASIAAQNACRNCLRTKSGLKELANGMKTTSTASKAATLGLKALSVAGNMLLSMGISMAISFVIGEIQDLVHAQENAIAKADEAISKINEEREALTKTKTTIDSISGDYEKLAKGVDNLGRNVSLSSDEYSRYNEIVNQIAEMFPQMVQGYTDEGNAIIAHKGSVEELTKAYKEQKEAAKAAIITGSADVYKGFKEKVYHESHGAYDNSGLIQMKYLGEDLIRGVGSEDFDIDKFKDQNIFAYSDFLYYAGVDPGEWRELENYIKDPTKHSSAQYQKVLAGVKKLTSEINAETAKIKPIMQAYLDNSFELNKVDDSTADLVRRVVGQFGAEFYAQLKDEVEMAAWIDENVVKKLQNKDVQAKFETALEIQTKFNNNEIPVKDYQEKVNALLETIKALPPETQKAIQLLFGIETDEDGNPTSDVDTMIASVKKKFNGKFEKEIGELKLGDLKKLSDMDISPNEIGSWAEVEEMLKNAVDLTDSAIASLSELKKSLDNIQSAYKSVQSAIQEYNEQGRLSVDTYQALMELEPKYLNMFVDENGNLNLNTEAVQKNTAAYVENMGIKAAQNLIDKVSSLSGETAQLEYLTGATEANTEATWDNVMSRLAEAELVSSPAVMEALRDRINVIYRLTQATQEENIF